MNLSDCSPVRFRCGRDEVARLYLFSVQVLPSLFLLNPACGHKYIIRLKCLETFSIMSWNGSWFNKHFMINSDLFGFICRSLILP